MLDDIEMHYSVAVFFVFGSCSITVVLGKQCVWLYQPVVHHFTTVLASWLS